MAEINPVLLKELRQRFRQGKTAWLLALYLLVLGGFVLAFIYLNWRSGPGFYQPGRNREIFMVLSFAQLVLLAFVTPGLTAGVISGERERQTLKVLLTTRLTTWGISWSKLVSATAFVVLMVIATLPMYSIVFLYGGMSPGQVLGVFGFNLLTMFLFASLGLVCSSFFKQTGVSTITSYGMVFALTGGTGFLAVFINEVTRINRPGVTANPGFFSWVVEFLQEINPIFVLMEILGEDGMNTSVSLGFPYWVIYAAFCLVSGLLLLFWSSRLLLPGRKS
jgi:ABC-2 type transport system permease protein